MTPLGTSRTNPQVAVLGGQAASGLQIELPAVEMAGQHTVLDLAEHGEIGLAVRAPPLHHIPAQLDLLDLGRGRQPVPGFRLGPTIRSSESDFRKL